MVLLSVLYIKLQVIDLVGSSSSSRSIASGVSAKKNKNLDVIDGEISDPDSDGEELEANLRSALDSDNSNDLDYPVCFKIHDRLTKGYRPP